MTESDMEWARSFIDDHFTVSIEERDRIALFLTIALAEARREEREACAQIAREHRAPSVLRTILDRVT